MTRKHNINSIRYSKEKARDILQIGEGFFEPFGVKNFVYSKLFNDGTRLYVGTCPEWLAYYLEREFQDNAEHVRCYIPGDNIKSTVWSGFEKDEIVEACHLKGLWHGFSIHRRREDYYEYFDFSTDKENFLFPSMCINNIEELESFCEYFKKEGREIVDHSDREKLIISRNWTPFDKIPRILEREDKFVSRFENKINIER